MNKNIIIVLLILLVPIVTYYGLEKGKTSYSSEFASANQVEIIKFSSPMCYECQQLEKVFEEVFPAYSDNVKLKKVDVTQKDNSIKALIKEHDVKLVPTTIFKDENGNTKHRIEGTMEPKVLEDHLKELIDG